MNKKYNEDKVLNRAISHSPIITLSKIMYFILFIALVISIIAFIFVASLESSGHVNYEESLYRIGIDLILFFSFYSIYRSKRSKLMNRFERYEEIPAHIKYVNSITLMRGASSISYGYVYKGISYNSKEFICDFNGSTRRLKVGDYFKVIVNIDNPNESLISDMCIN